MSYEDYEKAVKNPEDKTISEIALTTDGEKDFGFGMPRTFLNTDTLCDHKRKYVMGNWSPDGRYFAATLSDQRAVQDLWVINSIAKPRPTLETYKYQMPERRVLQSFIYISLIWKMPESGKKSGWIVLKIK